MKTSIEKALASVFFLIGIVLASVHASESGSEIRVFFIARLVWLIKFEKIEKQFFRDSRKNFFLKKKFFRDSRKNFFLEKKFFRDSRKNFFWFFDFMPGHPKKIKKIEKNGFFFEIRTKKLKKAPKKKKKRGNRRTEIKAKKKKIIIPPQIN